MQHVYTFVDPCSEKHMELACRVLSAGGLLAYPTDVNWAIGCDAANVKAIDRIWRLKPMHPREQPFSLLCNSIAMAAEVGVIDHAVYRALKRALPGPYTFFLQRNRVVARQFKDKRRVVGVRVPESPLIQEMLRRFGRPLATTSVPKVNVPGVIDPQPPRFGYQVVESFGHGLDLVFDLGDELVGGESTIIDFSGGFPVLIRQGLGDTSHFVFAEADGEEAAP